MKRAHQLQTLLLASIVLLGVALYGMVGNAFQSEAPEWWTYPLLFGGLIITCWLKSTAKRVAAPKATLPTNVALCGVLLTCITAHDYFAGYARALAVLFTLIGLAGMAYGWNSEERETRLGRELKARNATIKNLKSQIANLKRGSQNHQKSKPLLRRR